MTVTNIRKKTNGANRAKSGYDFESTPPEGLKKASNSQRSKIEGYVKGIITFIIEIDFDAKLFIDKFILNRNPKYDWVSIVNPDIMFEVKKYTLSQLVKGILFCEPLFKIAVLKIATLLLSKNLRDKYNKFLEEVYNHLFMDENFFKEWIQDKTRGVVGVYIKGTETKYQLVKMEHLIFYHKLVKNRYKGFDRVETYVKLDEQYLHYYQG